MMLHVVPVAVLFMLCVRAQPPMFHQPKFDEYGHPLRDQNNDQLYTIFSKQLPELYMNVTEVISFYGYPFEIHDVTTADGYILRLVRIPHGHNSNNNTTSGKQPVYLQHGFLDSAFTWVMNLPKQSLAYILADAGYDVWLGNIRGNTYSRKHVKYTTKDKEYWNFSFDEMARYDIPASLEYVLKVSGHAALYYVGHSQGTMVGFIEFGRNPALAKKVKKFFALAPVAKVKHMKGIFKLFTKFSHTVNFLFHVFGMREFLPSGWLFNLLARFVCQDAANWVCTDVIFLIAGYDRSQFNTTRVPIIVSHVPAGTSVKNSVHFSQMIKSGEFRRYDYGQDGNRKHYQRDTPPLYTPELMHVPVVLYSGDRDWLAQPADVKFLKRVLPNIIGTIDISYYNHFDLTWATNANRVIFDDILKRMT